MWTFPFQRNSVDEDIAKKLGIAALPLPTPETIAATPAPPLAIVKPRLLNTTELMKAYGEPGDPDNHITITVPFPFKVAWNLSKSTNRISCHKKIADRLLSVLSELLSFYGAVRIKELGIDLFGGLGIFRPQRGLEKKYANAIANKNYALAYTYLSRHSWWVALDLDPARNQLKQTSKTAQFAKPEYKPMIDIFYKHGFVGLGPEKNYDWMHFEIGS